jgi:hypothetical protein
VDESALAVESRGDVKSAREGAGRFGEIGYAACERLVTLQASDRGTTLWRNGHRRLSFQISPSLHRLQQQQLAQREQVE